MNLKGFSIVWSKRAKKNLDKIDKKDANTVLRKVNLLVTKEDMVDVKKIVDKKNLYRLRSGQYRVIYTIYEQEVIILVIDVGHRKEIYKNLIW
ncbi:MAG: hypothetical protein US13_C0003G0010 [candidate division TM6 bacterium GW2011_GWE2_36_25]|nr:MAG: hypothetical protein US03_C0003G0010 [candidate division TM6 bacterium GW2011_GWF2_36_131]KKQ03329.1 MAG: hypothetical protein US13_C0003G0010 [candidate division TM6 bacterium GW2011_GWE2_36_25]KKQ19725.1 MAG: hypothetical protein US32_C0005G0009 [candidate division TM6 bacterium GW2011_GWA2_36_9]HBR70892.1 hypothetical protein [Candidatus Dependentiae bacterium]